MKAQLAYGRSCRGAHRNAQHAIGPVRRAVPVRAGRLSPGGNLWPPRSPEQRRGIQPFDGAAVPGSAAPPRGGAGHGPAAPRRASEQRHGHCPQGTAGNPGGHGAGHRRQPCEPRVRLGFVQQRQLEQQRWVVGLGQLAEPQQRRIEQRRLRIQPVEHCGRAPGKCSAPVPSRPPADRPWRRVRWPLAGSIRRGWRPVMVRKPQRVCKAA